MTFGFLGGLANGYKGFQQGSDEELARQQLALDKVQLAKDRTYQQTRREFNQGQQARTVREQGITDSLQDEMKAMPTTREYEINTDRETNLPMYDNNESGEAGDDPQVSAAQLPATRSIPLTNAELHGRQADILQKAGRFAEAEKYRSVAEKEGLAQTAAKFAEWQSGSSRQTPQQKVESMTQILKDDPTGASIANPIFGDKGEITLTFVNDKLGKKITQTFANSDQLTDVFQARYSPDTWSATLTARQKAANTNVILPKGADLVNAQTGETKASNLTDQIMDGYNPDGSEHWITNPRGKGAAGAGAGKSVKLGPASKTIEDGMKNTPELIPAAMQHRDALYANNPGMTEALADSLGVRMATSNGQGVVSKFDPRTGLFNSILQDFPQTGKDGKPTGYATNKSYLLGSNSFTPGGGIPKEEAAKAAIEVAKSTTPEVLQGYLLTKTTKGDKDYDEKIRSAAMAALKKTESDLAAAKTPEEVTRINSAFANFKADLASDSRRMALVRDFYTPPTIKPATPTADPVKPVFATPGGLFNGANKDMASSNPMIANKAIAESAANWRSSQEGQKAQAQVTNKQSSLQEAIKDPRVQELQAYITQSTKAGKLSEVNRAMQMRDDYIAKTYPGAR